MTDEHPPESRDEMRNGSKAAIVVAIALFTILIPSGIVTWGWNSSNAELGSRIEAISNGQKAIGGQLAELQKAVAEQAREFAAFQGGYVQRRDNDDERYRGLSDDVKVLALKVQKLERDLAVLMERRP